MRRTLLLTGGLLLAAAPLHAQRRPPAPLAAAEIGAHLRFLASDELEGRYPGTRGERLTTAYLVAQLQAAGVQPGARDGWLQPVRITVHDPDSSSAPSVTASNGVTLEHGLHLRLSAWSARPEVAAGGELVFAGYGIHAPVYGWDDLAGADVRGKVVVARIGEPALDDTTRFNGVRASRFGWLHDKTEELERRGAVGVLWLRPDGRMSRAPVTGQRRLAADAARATLLFSGNITDSALARLLPPGTSLAALLDASARPGFRALPLGTRLDVRFRTRPREVLTHNVVGTIPGTDPARRDEHVVLSAHWDAYGIGPAVAGDSIYNGALDDASGTAEVLALARWFAAAPQPRAVTVAFFTAEEWGLLGAHAFVREGPVPVARLVANLNIDDGIELWGRKRDVATLGVELSSLGGTVRDWARRNGLRVSPDPYPQEGFFLRQDGYAFARAGVPALYMALGTDAEGRPAGWVDERVKEYLAKHYHRPSDDWETTVVDLAGTVQMTEFVRDIATAVARATGRPQWNAGGEFARPPEPAAGAPGGR